MKHSKDAILHEVQADYLDRMLKPRDALLQRMELRAREQGYPISDPEVAAFLTTVATALRPRFVVELGTNIGYGAVVLARAAGPEARVLTVECNPGLCAEARGFLDEAALAQRVEVRQGKALDVLRTLAPSSVDLAYVDCVKEEYPDYLEALQSRLRQGGVLVADNVLWKGLVARQATGTVPAAEAGRTEALARFNEALVGHPAFATSLLPLGDGVAIAVKTSP